MNDENLASNRQETVRKCRNCNRMDGVHMRRLTETTRNVYGSKITLLRGDNYLCDTCRMKLSGVQKKCHVTGCHERKLPYQYPPDGLALLCLSEECGDEVGAKVCGKHYKQIQRTRQGLQPALCAALGCPRAVKQGVELSAQKTWTWCAFPGWAEEAQCWKSRVRGCVRVLCKDHYDELSRYQDNPESIPPRLTTLIDTLSGSDDEEDTMEGAPASEYERRRILLAMLNTEQQRQPMCWATRLNGLTDGDFRRRYKLTKTDFHRLADKLRVFDASHFSNANHATPMELQLSMTLRYLAGGHVSDIADIHGVGESTCYAIVKRTMGNLAEILPLSFPSGDEAKRKRHTESQQDMGGAMVALAKVVASAMNTAPPTESDVDKAFEAGEYKGGGSEVLEGLGTGVTKRPRHNDNNIYHANSAKGED